MSGPVKFTLNLIEDQRSQKAVCQENSSHPITMPLAATSIFLLPQFNRIPCKYYNS